MKERTLDDFRFAFWPLKFSDHVYQRVITDSRINDASFRNNSKVIISKAFYVQKEHIEYYIVVTGVYQNVLDKAVKEEDIL